MHSKNHKAITEAERAHLGRVKALPCGVCSEPGPSEAHHLEQGMHWTVINLCPSCHRNGVLGLHGQRRMWAIHKATELGVLNETIRRLMSD